MSKQSRRSFLAKSTALAVAATLPFKNTQAMSKSNPPLVHHVFFWLKNPGSKADQQKLIEGVKTLAKIESIRALHVGVPADTEKRPVVDSSYDVSELIFFDDLAGQSAYQEHPIHKKFAAEYSYLWEKVVVYDSMTVK
jgi:hypothetical protein